MKYFWWGEPVPHPPGMQSRGFFSIEVEDLELGRGQIDRHWPPHVDAIKGLMAQGYTEISYMTAYEMGWPT